MKDHWWQSDSSVIRHVVDQSIQLGDGGWGIIAQAQIYQQLRPLPGASAYFVGTYVLSTREHTSVESPISGVTLGVPDVFYARGGIAYAIWPAEGLSSSLGLRIDGIMKRDIFGGGDHHFRRPGYTLFVDPGMALRLGRNELTLNVPIRLHQNFPPSIIDEERNRDGGGDLADYLVYVGLNHRF